MKGNLLKTIGHSDDIIKISMVRDARLLASFEDEQLRKERLTYAESLKIFEAMWEEAVSFGVLPLQNLLESIETDIELARILNSCSKSL